MNRRGQVIAENIIYYLIWLTVFAVTVIGFTDEGVIHWHLVGKFWMLSTPLFVLFLLNNYLIIPKLLLRKKYGAYVITTLAAILTVGAFCLVTRPPLNPDEMPPHGRSRYERERQAREFPKFPPASTDEAGEDSVALMLGSFPETDIAPGPEFRRGMPPRPFPFRFGPIFGVMLFSFFIVGLNIAIKLIFKTVNDSRVMEELERQNLRAELDYLKAQVNPHFFMNTLNNIHALVDIDTEKAKDTIIELSKIMRYILYDTDKPFVSLKLEVKFIQNYVSLMSIRYSGKVSIDTLYPDTLPEGKIAPLMLITLVENAFKHGISYRKPSFIKTCLEVDGDRLKYIVENSLTDNPPQEGGVGLENMRKRLTLLYGQDYALDLSRCDGRYLAVLEIPIVV